MIVLSDSWKEMISNSTTNIYEDGSVLSYRLEGEYMVVQSNSQHNKFSMSIIKDIHRLCAKYEKVIIVSTIQSISGFMAKHGFTFNEEHSMYIRR